MYSDQFLKSIANYLEANGFKRAVAGEADFTAAVNALAKMDETGFGLLVAGMYGCGKTLLGSIAAKNYRTGLNVHLGVPDETERLTAGYLEDYAINPYELSVFLDDLGAEPLVNEFGVKREITGDFICAWHLRHRPGYRLIITTNLDAEEIDSRYGGRVLSRLKDLCIPLRLTGGDKRKWTL